jgi:hypothetical protein
MVRAVSPSGLAILQFHCTLVGLLTRTGPRVLYLDSGLFPWVNAGVFSLEFPIQLFQKLLPLGTVRIRVGRLLGRIVGCALRHPEFDVQV